MISAKIIADSTYEGGTRLTTMQVTGHRFILAEFNTHRVFTRSSASSRAIPLRKQLAKVEQSPAVPVVFPAEQKGMQGGAEVKDVDKARETWKIASRLAAVQAEMLGEQGVHKSVANRVLEPFMWHTIVVTATAWENFFFLRLDADAQPEIRQLAEAMKAAYDESTPRVLSQGDWHLPYVDETDLAVIMSNLGLMALPSEVYRVAARISAARCARTSYLTQEGTRDLNEDVRLYDRLITDRMAEGKALHWSPLEHVATPWPANVQYYAPIYEDWTGEHQHVDVGHLPCVGNLLKWRSLRTTVEAETNTHTYA